MARPVNAPARRRELVAIAAKLFDRSGYHTVNLRAIAEAAGISKATLYHYFERKDQLLLGIHEEFMNTLLERDERRAGLSPTEHLRALMGDVIGLMETHRGHVRVFFEHFRELPPADQVTMRRQRDRYFDQVAAVVDQGVREGCFRVVDPRLTALAIFGACNWAYQWYQPDGALPAGEVAQRFGDIVLDGITARPEATRREASPGVALPPGAEPGG